MGIGIGSRKGFLQQIMKANNGLHKPLWLIYLLLSPSIHSFDNSGKWWNIGKSPGESYNSL
jgi:hypothetical protein